jgi:hypothetical protein
MKFKKFYLGAALGIVMAGVVLASSALLAGGAGSVAASDAAPAIVVPVADEAPGPQLRKYMVPRTLPGAEGFPSAQWKEVSAASNDVVAKMQDEGKQIYWLESFVGKDNVTCIYMATGPELLYEHARRGGFPINSVIEVTRMIEPATAR